MQLELDWWGIIGYLVLCIFAFALSYVILNDPFRPKHWIEHAVQIEGQNMPLQMMYLIIDSCVEAGVKIPRHMKVKFVPQTNSFLAGYTRYVEGGEICVVYGPRSLGYHNIEVEERETVLHEAAHWIMGEGEWDGTGGHTADFYAKLFELCLKNDVSTNYMRHTESRYMGDVVFDGISLFDKKYNA